MGRNKGNCGKWKEVGNLAVLLDQIKPEPEMRNIDLNTRNLIDEMVRANVRHVVNHLRS